MARQPRLAPRATHQGFAIRADTGQWVGRPDPDGTYAEAAGGPVLTNVRPYVRDTRNLLVVQVVEDEASRANRGFLVSLAYAVLRALQLLYHLEEGELAVEVVGEGEDQRLLFWENVEGGTGTWARLFERPDTWAEVATTALTLCHFDPETGADRASGPDACVQACYRCLLGYTNQALHPLLDRHRIRAFLDALQRAEGLPHAGGRTYAEQYAWCRERVDAASGEAAVLDALYAGRYRLPDRVQYRPVDELYAEADFYYQRPGRPGFCVFVDGPAHVDPSRHTRDAAMRTQLEDYGYRVIRLGYDRPWTEQFAQYPEVFGTPKSGSGTG